MVNNTILEKYLSEYLNISKFSDYCPNGLQVEGKSDICKIISGVSANQDLIDQKIIYSRIINFFSKLSNKLNSVLLNDIFLSFSSIFIFLNIPLIDLF